MSKEAIRQALAALSAEYRAGLAPRLQEIDALWLAAQSGEQAPLALRRELHSIAGSAATFGLPELTVAARAAEHYLDDCCDGGTPMPAQARPEFERLLLAVKRAAGEDSPA